MGSRPSKVSSTMSGMRTPVLKDDSTFLKSENFPLKSSITSIVPRVTRHAGVHENGFVTPRSRGRSAIYSMARTPYARVYPTLTPKVYLFPNDTLDYDITLVNCYIRFI